MRSKEPLTLAQILDWADRHHERTGTWPISRSGPVTDAADGTTWEAVNTALAKGARGLPGGDSLRQLLRRRRKAADARTTWPDLSRRKIIDWVDDHYQRTGHWPQRESGRVRCAKGITWATVDRYLRKGNRELPGGSSLSTLLWEARGILDGRPPLTEAIILKWAREHHEQTGRWPVTLSGKLRNHPKEDWAALDMALRHGRRGLTRKTSLSRLLSEHCGARYNPALGELTVAEILEHADRHRRRTGDWPNYRSGAVYGRPDLKWSTIEYALKTGRRGLPGGSTLAILLDRHRRADA